MADDKKDLQQGSDPIPSMRMSELGTIGLSVADKEVKEQVRADLSWPRVITTYKNMMNDPMINAGLYLIEMMISKIKWKVVHPSVSPTPDQLQKVEFIKQCMEDMDHSWEDFIREVLSYLSYGFSVHEKVFKVRKKKKGSLYDDGLVGWKKLSVRSQDTISKWEWSKDGRELKGVYQDLSKVYNSADRFNHFFDKKKHPEGILIPKNKFLLFRYNPKRDNPLGNSPLNACYIPWKFRTVIEEQEAIGISRDLQGMPVLGLHPKYMSPDASKEDQAIYEYYKNVIRNIHNNEQAGLIYPLMYNEQGKKIIEFDLMSSDGSKSYDTDKIIKRWDDKILTTLFADILKLGQQAHGSFSLAGAKTNIVAMNIEARLKEISGILNQDLIRHTFKLNGWDDTEFPQITYEDLDEEDLDEFSKVVQRIASVNMMPKDQLTVSEVMKRSGFENSDRIKDMPDEDFERVMPQNESRSGDGMKTAGEGTADNPSGKDNSSSNKENA